MNRHKGKYAWTATVGEKGQIVIPKQARDLFDIKPGDTVLILGDEERGLAIPGRSTLDDLRRIVFSDTEET
ncbi:MAG: AbrB/MazE/SpoVT family DNA-binding domain-containing protein [Clostridia bacterium]|nr:AbrB/MazE/SpoVT family DNA-binding domain-containing protein [Clostridia bacterium]